MREHVSISCFFPWVYSIPLYGWTFYLSFPPLWTFLDGLHFLAGLHNTAVMNICVQVCVGANSSWVGLWE